MVVVLALFAVLSSNPAQAAGALTADEIASKARAAMYPDLPSTRTLEIAVRAPDGSVASWSAKQARKNVGGKPHILTVLEHPESVAGFAILSASLAKDTESQWVYVPPVHRVRKLVYQGRFENFLGTDFSVEDFGFVDIHAATLTLLGQVEYAGQTAYVLREVPADPSGYSKILTWISTQSFLPMRRELFDANGVLWKTQRYEDVAVIAGIPTPLTIEVDNQQEGGSTRLTVSDVDYAAKLDDSLFRPAALAGMLTNPAW